ncbi:unnamed protein product [Cunninghamella blakesleeana]
MTQTTIQTTIPNYSDSNESTQPTMNNIQEQQNKKVFDLILVDLVHSTYADLKCVKRNMYDPDVKYICISYRWGELNEQLLDTPDYTAHITSFLLDDLKSLCDNIKYISELRIAGYLWIDAISVDQQDHARKKETILKMNQIYQNASFILAVPDLHYSYLLKNTANQELIRFIVKHKITIYNEIFNITQSSSTDSINNNSTNHIKNDILPQQHTDDNNNDNDNDDYHLAIQELKKNKDTINQVEILMKKIEALELKSKEIKEKEIEQEKEEIKKVYQYLAYLVDDWSNRAWVISEYQIAKEKYMKHGTPLKYWFMSLHIYEQPFFSYHFNDDHQQQYSSYNKRIANEEVIDSIIFKKFVKERFMQRPHLDMILDSNATRNEDRFNAILSSWKEYNHLIKDVPNWNITDMVSVRLKLYEIMDGDDNLWDRAKLLHTNNLKYFDNVDAILPSFASHYNMKKLSIIEKVNHDSADYKEFEEDTLDCICHYKYRDKNTSQIKQLWDEYHTNMIPLWTENLISIQLEQRHHRYLSVKPRSYFIYYGGWFVKYWDDWKRKLALDDNDVFHFVFIPFFTCNFPDCTDFPRTYQYCSCIFLAGNREKNKWILTQIDPYDFDPKNFCSVDYTFNIY